MLRDRDDCTTTWTDGRVQLGEYRLVVVDVLQNVERADDVELVSIRDAPTVDLHQRRSGGASPGDGETFGRELCSHPLSLRERLPDSAQHVAGSASELEEAPRRGEMAPDRRDQDPVSRAEPEAPFLQGG
jgi:hypothetical protein